MHGNYGGTMVYVKQFRCFNCGRTHSPEAVRDMAIMRCMDCNSAIDVEYDYGSIKKTILKDDFMRSAPTHWKYWAFLPVNDLSKIISMGEGGTPLLEVARLTPAGTSARILIKNEGVNPTGSFKDRGSALEVTKAMESGKGTLVLASTGNMGASVAAYSAFAGLRCRVYVPEFASSQKVSQMKAHGAEIIRTNGDYSQAMQMAEDYVRSHPDTFLTGDYPWRSEGTKTVAYEIVDQMYFHVPDYIFIPIGNGTLMWGVYEGLRDLISIGIIDRMPQLVGVQAQGCNPVVHAWESKSHSITAIHNPQTIATAISCGDPIQGLGALAAIINTRGNGVEVTDEEILKARDELALCGIFTEPSGAVAYAGFLSMHKKMQHEMKDKTIVCLATGHGLKDMYGL